MVINIVTIAVFKLLYILVVLIDIKVTDNSDSNTGNNNDSNNHNNKYNDSGISNNTDLNNSHVVIYLLIYIYFTMNKTVIIFIIADNHKFHANIQSCHCL